MAQIKISDLPLYTGSTTGVYLVMNNSGETTTYKVSRENIIGASGTSGTSGTSGSSGGTGTSGSNGSSGTSGDSLFALTGSVWNTTNNVGISGSLVITGGTAAYDLIVSGGVKLTRNLWIGDNLYNPYVIITSTGSILLDINSGKSASLYLETNSGGGENFGYNEIEVLSGSGVYYSDSDIVNNKSTYLTIPLAVTSGSFNAPQFKRGLAITGSLNVSGNTTITGSINTNGNVFINDVNGNTTLYGNVIFVESTNGLTGTTITKNYLELADPSGTYNITKISGSAVSMGWTGTSVTSITGSLQVTGSLIVQGNTILTGSVQGNITPLTISSNTASLNLNSGNFFTLQLVSGSATHINPTNIKPGQSANILISTTGSATVTFPSSVKQPSNMTYTASTGTSKDILSLLTYDTSSVYLISAKTLS